MDSGFKKEKEECSDLWPPPSAFCCSLKKYRTRFTTSSAVYVAYVWSVAFTCLTPIVGCSVQQITAITHCPRKPSLGWHLTAIIFWDVALVPKAIMAFVYCSQLSTENKGLTSCDLWQMSLGPRETKLNYLTSAWIEAVNQPSGSWRGGGTPSNWEHLQKNPIWMLKSEVKTPVEMQAIKCSKHHPLISRCNTPKSASHH